MVPEKVQTTHCSPDDQSERSSLPPFLPSSLPPFLPSSLPPFLPSSLPPFLPSSRPPFLPHIHHSNLFRIRRLEDRTRASHRLTLRPPCLTTAATAAVRHARRLEHAAATAPSHRRGAARPAFARATGGIHSYSTVSGRHADQLTQLPAAALRALGILITAHQRFKFVFTFGADVFINRHLKRAPSMRFGYGPGTFHRFNSRIRCGPKRSGLRPRPMRCPSKTPKREDRCRYPY